MDNLGEVRSLFLGLFFLGLGLGFLRFKLEAYFSLLKEKTVYNSNSISGTSPTPLSIIQCYQDPKVLSHHQVLSKGTPIFKKVLMIICTKPLCYT